MLALPRPASGPVLGLGVDTFASRNERIVIPGYASLRDCSRSEVAAIKDGLRGRFWTLVHWTNWRMTFPSPPGQQERAARERVAELRAGRPVQLFVTDFPRIKFNHSVLAFDYRAAGAGALDFAGDRPPRPARRAFSRFATLRRLGAVLPRLPSVLLAVLLVVL